MKSRFVGFSTQAKNQVSD